MASTTGSELVAAVARRHREVVAAVAALGEVELRAPTRLPGWDALTVVCHLRFGALASARMTDGALAGRPTAFYPEGRSQQRPDTLRPSAGESPADVVASLEQACRDLDRRWAEVGEAGWATPLVEPADNADLGSIDLWTLALLRLTEIEVHGSDLDLGLSPWSPAFVTAALPARLARLPGRRSNHRPVDRSRRGSWALVSSDGPRVVVETDGDRVTVSEASGDEPAADARIEGTAAELLAFILGRRPLDDLRVGGDEELARSFLLAFPAP